MAAANALPPAVACRAVAKVYGEGETTVHALRGIDLLIQPGELMMLVGPSGCGKTTLISIIAGILEKTAGDCLVFGKNLSAMTPGERAAWRRDHAGFVFQSFNLMPALTATENVAIPLLIQGRPHAEALERAAEMLNRVGLANRRDALPAQLSGGQQQRVAIGRALVHEPRLVVCDEPTSALDHETGHQVMEVLHSLATRDGHTLVVVTHDERIFEFADNIARMDDGRVTTISGGERSRKTQ
ncbi:MAG: ABC transporter ATP-binding protein [Proteobacteria bacterium]|nr:ABC transporter ATP-binding protein [Pseudomonadota bacterium]